MLSAEASSAICVQRLDDSRNSAIHTKYRISLRSSSIREPRYPLLRVVFRFARRSVGSFASESESVSGGATPEGPRPATQKRVSIGSLCRAEAPTHPALERAREGGAEGAHPTRKRRRAPIGKRWSPGLFDRFNDPSAGSPTETLLRLLLPLDRRVQRNSQRQQMENHRLPPILALHQHIQSVGATGGVYKGQGRSQRELMTRAY